MLPNCTAVAAFRLVPMIVTTLPPPVGPVVAATAMTVGRVPV
jgi:hypothetical protein